MPAGRAFATAAGVLVPPGTGQHLAARVGWVTGPHVLTTPERAADLAATVEAEDGFDLATCRDRMQVPALIIAGGRDRYSTQELFAETTQRSRTADYEFFLIADGSPSPSITPPEQK